MWGKGRQPCEDSGDSSWQLAGAQLALAAWCIYQQAEGGRVEAQKQAPRAAKRPNNNQGEMCKIL